MAQQSNVTLKDAVIAMITRFEKTEADIADVVMNHPTDPTVVYVLFTDSTYAKIELTRAMDD